jgi:hypothetical protein
MIIFFKTMILVSIVTLFTLCSNNNNNNNNNNIVNNLKFRAYPKSAIIMPNTNYQLHAYIINSEGIESEVTNSSLLSWSSSNNNIIEVTTTGMIHSNNIVDETVTINIQYNNNGNLYYNNIPITVTSSQPQSILITPESSSILVGDKLSLTAYIKYNNESISVLTNNINWSVKNDTGNATIDLYGTIIGNQIGQVTAVASYGGISGETNISILGISLGNKYSNISIAKQENYQLQLFDANHNNISNQATWISSNPNIASVNSSGNVLIESSEGSASIYAQYQGYTSNSITFNSGRIIFATKSTYNGNLVQAAKSLGYNTDNGIIAANYLCNIDNNKPEFGNFKALISNSINTTNYKSVIDTSKIVNYINKNGSIIGISSNRTDLPILVFIGKFINNTTSADTILNTWSGFATNNDQYSYACNNWSDNSPNTIGAVGYGNNSNYWYTNDTSGLDFKGIYSYLNQNCGMFLPLICVQQPTE